MSASTWAWIGGTSDVTSPTDWMLTSGSGNAGGVPASGDTAVNTGTLSGSGAIAALLINSGSVIAIGMLDLEGGLSGSGTAFIAPGGTLRIDGPLDQAQTIAFSPGAPETLILGAATGATAGGTIAAAIIGFGAGDRIEFGDGIMITAASVVSGTTLEVDVLTADGTVGTYDLTGVTFAADAPPTLGFANVDPATGDSLVAPANFIGWTGATDTDFGTGTNWNFGGIAPGPLDVAYFDNGAGGTISGSGVVEALVFDNAGTWSLAPGTSLSAIGYVGIGAGLTLTGQGTGTAGALDIGAGSTVTTAGGFISVGQTAGSTASLTVSGVLQETAETLPALFAMQVGTELGSGSGAAGSVLVSGAGALIDLGTNGLDLGDGGGHGTMIIQQGGSVNVGTPDSSARAALLVGQLGSGGVTVTGAGSQLTVDGVASVGQGGSGSLSISSQGNVAIGLDGLGAGGLFIGGYGPGASSGTLYAGSSGTAIISTGGSLFSQGDIQLGGNGDSGLMILQAGTVATAGTLWLGGSTTLAAGETLVGSSGITTVGTATVEAGNGQMIVSLGTVMVQGLEERAGSTISLLNGTLLNSGTASTSGVITGSGLFTGALTSDGSITANRGTLDFTGGISGSGSITINGGAALRSDGQLADSQTVTFATSGIAAQLILGAPQATNAFAIDNWQIGDVIDFTNGASVSGVEWLGNGTLAVDTSAGTVDFTDVSLAAAALPKFLSGPTSVELVPCFLRGTRIATPGGEVAVERLKVGDLVLTRSGRARPVLWVGMGRALATRGRRTAATPVIVRQGALGENVPHRDLHVTKGHSLFIDDVLIPAEFLVNHRSIVWDDRAQAVEVYHIELQTHDVLIAEGAPAETYRDDGNRWLFQNANTGWEQPDPPPPYAPVITGGAVLDAIWRRLLDRAGAEDCATTEDADLHLLVDGARVDGEVGPAGVHRFRLGRRPAMVRVVSRAGSPAELGLARDPRRLGVAIRAVRLWRGPVLRVVDASDEALQDGFHLFEADNGFRWTDGDAGLPGGLFDGMNSAFELELHVGATAQYPVEASGERQIAA